MKTYKKFSLIITIVMIFSLIWVSGASAKPGGKVVVCHNKGNGTYKLTKIKADTLQAHLSHGDAFPGQAVPGQAGMVFGADCSLLSTAPIEPSQPLTAPSTTNNDKNAGKKVDVCHRRGNGTFIMINISRNALQAHLNHGDGLPNGLVSNQPGMQFTATCSVTEVPQKELVQSFTVSPTGATFDSVTLEKDQLYEIIVSGTYTYDPQKDWADAEYFLQNGVIKKGDSEYPSTPNVLDLSIGSCSTNTDWGMFQNTHVYTTQWTGTGAPLSFCIFDLDYSDNVGSLTVEIWKVTP